MKCISCECQIDPKWKHAIDINVCPFCGANILDEALKELLSNLRLLMDEMQQYPDQLNDWMLSNYNFIKADSPELKKLLKSPLSSKDIESREKFKAKIKTENGEEEIDAEKLASEEDTSEFFKRSDALKSKDQMSIAEKTESLKAKKAEELKKMTHAIKRHGSGEIERQGPNPYDNIITAEMMDQADSEAIAELQSAISGGAETMQDTSNDSYDGDEIPSVVMNMANKTKNNSGKSKMSDIEMLQNAYNRNEQSKKRFQNGSGGFFRS